MMFSITTTSNLFAYAGGWLDYAKPIEFDTTYTESASKSDYLNIEWYSDSFYFNVPQTGKVSIYMESNNMYYLDYENSNDDYSTVYNIYSADNVDVALYSGTYYGSSYSSARDVYYGTNTFVLEKGNYYLLMQYCSNYGYEAYVGTTYDITFSYKPNISTPSNFKVASRGATSIKLAWNKVSGVSGYQLQYKNGDSYKTITNTTSTEVTVKNLSSATNYKFRVRAYKTVNGKKYYGSWKYLTTPTKPSKVSIKSPSTNSKHQIIAKWNKVTRASGYQVQYCKNSSCSNVIATKTVSGGSKTSYTGKNFTKGKKYYVRVRAYKTVDGTKYYGAWSSVKSIKCK